VAFAPDGKRLLSGSRDETVRLWDVESEQVVAAFEWKIGAIRSVAFSPSGMTAAAAGDDGTIVIWDID
jgi:WD40 repeat protein